MCHFILCIITLSCIKYFNSFNFFRNEGQNKLDKHIIAENLNFRRYNETCYDDTFANLFIRSSQSIIILI